MLSSDILQHTTVIGITGAFGKINLVSENFERRRQFSARSIHPAPSSPRPWTKMTVAVCLATAGTTNGADMIIEAMMKSVRSELSDCVVYSRSSKAIALLKLLSRLDKGDCVMVHAQL